jgi:hypothetical protein
MSGPGSSSCAPSSRIRPGCGSTTRSGQTPGTSHGIPVHRAGQPVRGLRPAQRLQARWDQLTATELQRCFDRWLARIPPRSPWPTRPPGSGGSVAGTGRGLPPRSWSTPPPGTSVRCGDGQRQPLARAARPGQLIFDRRVGNDTRAPSPPSSAPAGSSHHQRLRPALPEQAIPEARPSAGGATVGTSPTTSAASVGWATSTSRNQRLARQPAAADHRGVARAVLSPPSWSSGWHRP